MTFQIKGPGASTHRARSNHFRFSCNGSVNTAIWQSKSREQLDTWRGTGAGRGVGKPIAEVLATVGVQNLCGW